MADQAAEAMEQPAGFQAVAGSETANFSLPAVISVPEAPTVFRAPVRAIDTPREQTCLPLPKGVTWRWGKNSGDIEAGVVSVANVLADAAEAGPTGVAMALDLDRETEVNL